MAIVDSRQIKRVAVTNAPRANTELMLRALRLDGWFSHVVLGEECSRPKPFPDPYIQGLHALGLTSSEALVFEDSPAGVTAAVAAGLRVVALRTGQTDSVLLEAGAQIVVDDFHAVISLLQAPV
jgi:HAD superfamily hydrolase (TIGR01509 family)